MILTPTKLYRGSNFVNGSRSMPRNLRRVQLLSAARTTMTHLSGLLFMLFYRILLPLHSFILLARLVMELVVALRRRQAPHAGQGGAQAQYSIRSVLISMALRNPQRIE